MVKFVQNPRLYLKILPRRSYGHSIFTEAEEISSFLGKTEAEDSVDHSVVHIDIFIFDLIKDFKALVPSNASR